MKSLNAPMLEAALGYVAKGWYVFPLHTVVEGKCSCGNTSCEDAGKHPRVPRGLREATNDVERIKQWFAEDAPPANIAIATGQGSNLTVFDIDIGAGKKGADTWNEAIKEEGEPDTLMFETGSGGTHVLFTYNSSLKTASNVLGPGVDCRNDGGYIVAPPSRHRSGGSYKVLSERPLAPVPAHLSRRKENRGRKRKDDPYEQRYSLAQVREMLSVVSADDRDLWRNVGIILGREFKRSDEAWKVYVEWANKYKGKVGRNHQEIMSEAFNIISQQGGERELSVGTIVHVALKEGWAPKAGEVPLDDFLYWGPGNNYIYRPTGDDSWISAAVDAAVSPVNTDGKIQKASEWLKHHRLVTSRTRDPIIEGDYKKGFNCRNGEIIPGVGAALYNGYQPPTIELGDARLAKPFVDHVRKIFNKPGDADQFLDYMAHRRQKPWEKPRFALMLAGGQGVGKDTAIEFCLPAIGRGNCANIAPAAFEGSFNEFAGAVLVRISEAANLHEQTRWMFNEQIKVLTAGSPDIMEINPKYGQKYFVRMHCGVVLTTNHLANGIYVPPDDRRYDIIDAATKEEMGLDTDKKSQDYFDNLWWWFEHEDGDRHVAAFLQSRDLSKFSASQGQRKTSAHSVTIAGGLTSDTWLDDILDELGSPIAVRADWILTKAIAAGEKEADVKRKLASSIGRLKYVMYKNPSTMDGRWKKDGKKFTVYVKAGTPPTFNPLLDLPGTPAI